MIVAESKAGSVRCVKLMHADPDRWAEFIATFVESLRGFLFFFPRDVGIVYLLDVANTWSEISEVSRPVL